MTHIPAPAKTRYFMTIRLTIEADKISDIDDDRYADALMAFPEVHALEGEGPYPVAAVEGGPPEE